MNGDNQNRTADFDFENNSIVKKYFSRIFTTMKSDIRKKLNELDLDEEKKKKIKRELAFLPQEKQREYLDEILNEY